MTENQIKERLSYATMLGAASPTAFVEFVEIFLAARKAVKEEEAAAKKAATE